jgi:hypothetical protein
MKAARWASSLLALEIPLRGRWPQIHTELRALIWRMSFIQSRTLERKRAPSVGSTQRFVERPRFGP